APTGSVITQEIKILRTTPKLSAAIPRAKPTPSTAPTRGCVVEIGKAAPEAITTVEAADSSAANPRLGGKWVMAVPTVLITLAPKVAKPTTIPTAPNGKIHQANCALLAISPPELTTLTTAAKGPIALATSFEPWAKAIQQAVVIINTPKIRSTLLNCIFLSAAGSNFNLLITTLPIRPITTAMAIEM